MYKRYSAPRGPQRAGAILFCILTAICYVARTCFLWCDCGPDSVYFLSCLQSTLIFSVIGRWPLGHPKSTGNHLSVRKDSPGADHSY